MHRQASCPRLNNIVSPSQNIRILYNFASGKWHHAHGLHSNTRDASEATQYDLKAGVEGQSPTVKRRLENHKDIILHDLSATLQAHRATNVRKLNKKRSTFRKLVANFDWQSTKFIRPSKFQLSTPTNKSAPNSANLYTIPDAILATSEAHLANNVTPIVHIAAVRRKVIRRVGTDEGTTNRHADSSKRMRIRHFEPVKGKFIRRVASDKETTNRHADSSKRMRIRHFESVKAKSARSFLIPSFLVPKEALFLPKSAAALKRVRAKSKPIISREISGSRAPGLHQFDKTNPNRLRVDKVRDSRNRASYHGGQNIDPLGQWLWSKERSEKSTKSTKSPWISLMTDNEGDGLARLEKEIRAYRAYIDLKHYETAAFKLLVSEIHSLTQKDHNCPILHRSGSYSIDLPTSTSNADFRLSLPKYERDPLSRGPSASRPESCKAVRKSLGILCRFLENSPLFRDVKLVPASMWHLNAVHSPTELSFSIQANPIEPPSQRLMMTSMSEFPKLRSVFGVIRMALEMRGLNTVSSGGLSEYELFMMIVYVLKCDDTGLLGRDEASQLLHILGFYSNIDLCKYGFSVDPPRMFDKTRTGMNSAYAVEHCINMLPLMDVERPYLLCLQDPADPKISLGSAAYGIKDVQAVFGAARRDIKYAMREWEGMDKSERQSSQLSCLAPLVGANYQSIEERRTRLKKTMEDQQEGSQASAE